MHNNVREPAGHRQRDPRQRRFLRRRASGSARRTPATTATTDLTAGPQPDPRQRRHQPRRRHRALHRQRRLPGRPTTRSAATSPRSTAARSPRSATRRDTARRPRRPIASNRIWFNASYDEGGAVMVAGELPGRPDRAVARARARSPSTATSSRPTSPTTTVAASGSCRRAARTSPGSTPATITITNNTIANNVSAHEGGGIALDDAAFVNIVDNTVAKNLTTATAVTSDGDAGTGRPLDRGQQRPAAGAAAQHGFAFPGRATLAATTFSKPTLLDNVFWRQPGRQLQRRLRLRHRRHAARRLGQRRRTTGTWASSDVPGAARPG